VRYDATYYYNDGALWDNTGNPLRRVENFGASDFTTTLRYDNVYRETEETKRDSGGGLVYTHLYSYDEVGNRIGRNDGGTRTLYHGYDANNKLSYTRWVGGGQPPGPITANFYYDGAGNMTSVTGTEFGAKTLTYDDESRLSSIAYGGVTDSYTYNWQGLRTRAYLNGTYYRYLYNGERVLQELTDAGAVTATYTTENDSYYGTLLHLKRATGESRFPLYDSIGSARGLVDASGTVTDTYDMDTFGTARSSTGSTPNPYRYGAAWGYITDPSGFLQLGARYYWPEVGRFVQQDALLEGPNRYAYVGGRPTKMLDADGERAYDAACAHREARSALKATAESGLYRKDGEGPGNAFQHCIWSCKMVKNCGWSTAFTAGTGHEFHHRDARGNRFSPYLGDREASRRDLCNNEAGRVLGLRYPKSCADACKDALNRGKLVFICPPPKPKLPCGQRFRSG